jgi:FkbM family methyltransferase
MEKCWNLFLMPSKPKFPVQSMIRGFLYHQMTRGLLAATVGRVAPDRLRDDNGKLVIPDSKDWRLISSIRFNVYEFSERYLIGRYLPTRFDCIELGASLGIVSREILKRLAPDKRLVSVEAVPYLKEIAEHNIELAAPGRATIRQSAIDYTAATVNFAVGSSNLSGRLAEKNPSADSVTVPTITLSRLIEEEGIQNYSLVMDIEGAEYQVVRRDLSALERCKCLIAELHGSAAEKMNFQNSMEEIGLHLKAEKHTVSAFLRH